ncbi:MAG: hypothetical protein ACOX4P_00265 [Anaerovoracaceae bacterium]
MTSCYAQSETAHFAHVELLFTAKTLLCYAFWELNKEGTEQAPTLSEMVRYFFNVSYRIDCSEQQIQIHFDTIAERFARLLVIFGQHYRKLDYGVGIFILQLHKSCIKVFRKK